MAPRRRVTLILQILCMHGGLSPDLQSMEQIRRVMRPTDVPDTGLLCDLLWSDPDKDIQVRYPVGADLTVQGWSENDRGVSFTFGPDVVSRFLQKHDMDLICRAHQVVEDGCACDPSSDPIDVRRRVLRETSARHSLLGAGASQSPFAPIADSAELLRSAAPSCCAR